MVVDGLGIAAVRIGGYELVPAVTDVEQVTAEISFGAEDIPWFAVWLELGPHMLDAAVFTGRGICAEREVALEVHLAGLGLPNEITRIAAVGYAAAFTCRRTGLIGA